MGRSEKQQDFFNRLQQALNDEDFKNICLSRKREISNFDEQLNIAETLAKIDISNYKTNPELIYLTHPYTKDEMVDGITGFYSFLDSLSPEGINLTKTAQNNLKYFHYETAFNNKNLERSYCCSRVLKDGSTYRIIFCFLEGRVGDIINTTHEFAHSLGKTFLECAQRKDIQISELPTMIVDALSTYYFEDKFPSLSVNFNEHKIFKMLQTVAKAKESFVEGMLMKVALGEETLENIEQMHPELFYSKLMEKQLNAITSTTQKIKNPNYKLSDGETYFAYMFEYKYLIPIAASDIILERFKTNPNEVSKQLKTLFENEHQWTIEDGLKNFNLSNKIEIVRIYEEKFHKEMQLLILNREHSVN